MKNIRNKLQHVKVFNTLYSGSLWIYLSHNVDDIEFFLEYVDVSGEKPFGCRFPDGSAGNVTRENIMRQINSYNLQSKLDGTIQL
jgi:hypothetical protein